MKIRSAILVIFIFVGVAKSQDTLDLAGPPTGYWDAEGTPSITVDVPITFTIRMVVGTQMVSGLTNAFQVFISDQQDGSNILSGVPFEPVAGDTIFDMIHNGDLDGGFFINTFSDGFGADTIGFSGFDLFDFSNLTVGFDKDVYIMNTQVASDLSGLGYYLCIDSSYFPPGGAWLWSTISAFNVFPSWGGPYCYEIRHCCLGNLGNLDLKTGPGGSVDITDLSVLVSYLFNGFTDIACVTVGNVNGIGGVDISDLTYLVAYMFGGGPAPLDCP